MGARDQLSKCQRKRQYQPWRNISDLVRMLTMKAQFQFLFMYHALYCACLLEQAFLSTRMICCQHLCIVIMCYTDLPQWLTKLSCPISWCLWDYRHSQCYQTYKTFKKMPRYLGFDFSLGSNARRPKWGNAPR